DEADMTSKKRKSQKPNEDEAMILGSFLDFAEKGEDEFARFLLHCGIDNNDIELAGDIQSAILEHYRRPDGTYDIDSVAHDWFRWPPMQPASRNSSVRSGDRSWLVRFQNRRSADPWRIGPRTGSFKPRPFWGVASAFFNSEPGQRET